MLFMFCFPPFNFKFPLLHLSSHPGHTSNGLPVHLPIFIKAIPGQPFLFIEAFPVEKNSGLPVVTFTRCSHEKPTLRDIIITWEPEHAQKKERWQFESQICVATVPHMFPGGRSDDHFLLPRSKSKQLHPSQAPGHKAPKLEFKPTWTPDHFIEANHIEFSKGPQVQQSSAINIEMANRLCLPGTKVCSLFTIPIPVYFNKYMQIYNGNIHPNTCSSCQCYLGH